MIYFTGTEVKKEMNNKRVGIILFIISIALLVIFITVSTNLEAKSEELGCFQNKDCEPIQTSLSFTHVGYGIFGFILALSFYLLFLSKGDGAILQHLEEKQQQLTSSQKFDILLRGLDTFEQEVIQTVHVEPGILQNALRLRVDMSKAKLSQVLAQLEKKKLIKREPQKKTLAIYPTLDF
jgi:uncharacterized membrane protein